MQVTVTLPDHVVLPAGGSLGSVLLLPWAPCCSGREMEQDTSVLLGNAREEKQKFSARVIVKGSGTHPLFIF